jgi:hypothetical protein
MIPPLSSRMRLVANLPLVSTGLRRVRLHFMKRQQTAALVPRIRRKEMLLPAIVPLNGSGVEINFYRRARREGNRSGLHLSEAT